MLPRDKFFPLSLILTFWAIVVEGRQLINETVNTTMFENRVKETGLSVSGLFFPAQPLSYLCLLAHHLPRPLSQPS